MIALIANNRFICHSLKYGRTVLGLFEVLDTITIQYHMVIFVISFNIFMTDLDLDL